MNSSDVADTEELSEREYTDHADSAGFLFYLFIFIFKHHWDFPSGFPCIWGYNGRVLIKKNKKNKNPNSF